MHAVARGMAALPAALEARALALRVLKAAVLERCTAVASTADGTAREADELAAAVTAETARAAAAEADAAALAITADEASAAKDRVAAEVSNASLAQPMEIGVHATCSSLTTLCTATVTALDIGRRGVTALALYRD